MTHRRGARRRRRSPSGRERAGRDRRPGGRPRGGGAVPRATRAVRRRGPAAADRRRLPGRPRRGRHRAAARARDARRRGVRAGLGRVARPGPAARRACHPPGARAQGRRPRARSTSSSRSVARPQRDADSDDERRDLAGPGRRGAPARPQRARSLARVADPRQRRQRAYALLARNGFDPEVCRSGRGVAGRARPMTTRATDDVGTSA